MKELLFSYLMLPLVYSIYKAGELADEKGRTPVTWRIYSYLFTFTAGLLFAVPAALLIYVANDEQVNNLLIGWSGGIFIFCALAAGFIFLSLLKRRKPKPQPKRAHRAYDFRNALVFPRIIPRGGFLWRSIVYTVVINIMAVVIILTATTILNLIATLSTTAFLITAIAFLYLSVAIICFGMLYYISYICIPRIRDAGLSHDTVVLFFIPGLNVVATFMLLAMPSGKFGKPSF